MLFVILLYSEWSILGCREGERIEKILNERITRRDKVYFIFRHFYIYDNSDSQNIILLSLS